MTGFAGIVKVAEIAAPYIVVSTQIAVIVALALVVVAILLRHNNNSLHRLMLVISFGALVQNAGYLLEIGSNNIGEAMLAIRVEYLVGAYAATLFLALVIVYCGYAFPKKLFIWLSIWDTIVLLAVWTSQFHTAYYTEITLVKESVIPCVQLGKGWIYITNAILTSIQIIACTVITARSLGRVQDITQRRNQRLLMVSSLFPLVSYLFGLTGLTSGYDPVPLGVGLGIALMSTAVLFRHAFDLVEIAHENIIQNMDEAVLIADSNDCYVEANPQAKRLFPELVSLRKGQTMRTGRLELLLGDREDHELTMNDRTYHVHRNEIILEHTMVGFVIILFDITGERQQLVHVQNLKEEADRANHAKSDFLAHVSHEIRTPITAVLGMNEMILRESNEPETRQYAGDIQTAAGTLLSIINDILDSSRIESGKLEIMQVEYELARLVNDVYNMILVKANEKQLELRISVDPKLPSVLYGDDIRIRQILLNLLSNGVKYTENGMVSLTVKGIQINEEAGTVQLAFEVSDTGIGIREEDMPHLFEAFERIEHNRNRSIEGTGLGMSIAVQLLAMMNSELHVDSTYGAGSTFTFQLEQKIIDLKPIGQQSEYLKECKGPELHRVSFVAPKARILIVDDSLTNRRVFKGLLRQTNVQISEAESGQQCLEMIGQEHFDVIFMDDMMPVMDGRQTLQRIRENTQHLCQDTPVIMLTANAMHGEKEKYLAMGFDDFLTKPINPKLLEAMLGRKLPSVLVEWSIEERAFS